ncbi:MAG: hypothetical protein MRZ46_00110 [Oscillospiraceae bacterium]|nr:hypothetical protein [Oscillospiraceae bacterium]MDY3258502.1 hypothetical protein [Ruminococcus callidus]
MAKIDSINRVLVLEKFNDKVSAKIAGKERPLSILNALKGAVDPDTDTFNYKQVDVAGLEVSSFDDFLERFAPDLYQGFQKDDNGGYFVYSTDPSDIPEALPMKFERTAFYKAAIDMYEKKAVAGKSNYEFDYSCFSKLISPSTMLKEIKNKRREYLYLVQKCLEAKDNKNTALQKSYTKKIKNTITEINETYKDNPTALLCLNVADLQKKLGINSDNNGKSSSIGIDTTKRDTYRLAYNSDGDIVKEKVLVTDINTNVNQKISLETRANNQATKLLESNIRGNENTSESDAYTQNLVISAYSDNTGIVASEDIPKLKKRYEVQKSFYKASQDSLLKAINKIIEKIIDVKALFDNAGGNCSVIIANCTADEIVSDSNIKRYFKEYMDNINGNIEKRIWFAVLPQIDDEDLVNRDNAGRLYTPDIPDADESVNEEDIVIDVEQDNDTDSEMSDDIDLDDADETEAKQDLISLDTAKQIMDILSEAKCTTFFGYKGCEKTGFSKMNKKVLDMYKKKLDIINSRYSVFAYPNFTLMSGIQAGDIEVADGETIQNPGLYLDAPYVAAGLVIKSLDSRQLEKMKFNVNKDLPKVCVRFDFEDSDNKYKVISNMNCEEILSYDKDLINELSEEPFGFFFDCCGYYNNEKVKNSFVKYARNMAKGENRIFTTLVKDFIFLEAADGEGTISKKKFDGYKAENKWSRDSYNGCINNPLHNGEELGYKEKDGKFYSYVKFTNGDKEDKFDDFVIENTEE